MRQIILVLVIAPYTLFAQNVIQGLIQDHTNSAVYLQAYEGYRSPLIDSVKTDNKGAFVLHYTAPYEAGMMRFTISKGSSPEQSSVIDLAVEDTIAFTTTKKLPTQNVTFSKGELNRAFYTLLNDIENLREKQYALEDAMEVFVDDASFSKKLNKKWKVSARQIDKSYNQFYKKADNHQFSEIVKAMQQWESKTPNSRIPRKDDFWVGKSFDHPVLLRWNMISQKTLQFFALYAQDKLSYEEAVLSYQAFIDQSLEPLKNNTPLLENTLEFLVDGFTQMGLDEMLEYIDENYFQQGLCGNDNESLMYKIASIRTLKPGNPAPPVNMEGFSLHEIKSEFVLVVFFSPDCSHCRSEFAYWQELTGKYASSKLTVLGISLDNDQKGIAEMNNKPPKNWKVAFNQAAVDSYGIHATPTFILVDKNKKIAARIRDLRELDSYIP